MMKLLLVRHGSAGTAATDELRPLTEEGKGELGRVARALARIDWDGAEIWQSGLLRAEESAGIVAKGLGLEQVMSLHPELAPNEPPMRVVEAIQGRKRDLILV